MQCVLFCSKVIKTCQQDCVGLGTNRVTVHMKMYENSLLEERDIWRQGTTDLVCGVSIANTLAVLLLLINEAGTDIVLLLISYCMWTSDSPIVHVKYIQLNTFAKYTSWKTWLWKCYKRYCMSTDQFQITGPLMDQKNTKTKVFLR